MSTCPPTIIVLAAGASVRMGQPKQLLMHEGRTLVRRAVETALCAGPVVVVLGANEDLVRENLSGLPVTFAINAAWHEGIASSIRTGVQAVLDAPAVVIMLCDQPLVLPETLRALIASHHIEGSRLVACQYDGALGVPALFDRSLFGELLALQGSHGAKKILTVHGDEARGIPFEDGMIDVDTPEQYARLQGSSEPP